MGKLLVIGVLAVTAGLIAVMSLGNATTGPKTPCVRYCVAVAPMEGDEGTTFRFTGRRWRPRRIVTASFGDFCDRSDCEGVGRTAQFRTNRRGGFHFRFREGLAEPGDRSKGIRSGEGPVAFDQRRNGPFSGGIRRKPRYEVNRGLF